mmetsp:Transcript_106759/g.340863  ORF Transcript_106759/g.340863 Transcript_106759/m.340863 type:complete len:200 (-) Transcript_106759:661-1260(-)
MAASPALLRRCCPSSSLCGPLPDSLSSPSSSGSSSFSSPAAPGGPPALTPSPAEPAFGIHRRVAGRHAAWPAATVAEPGGAGAGAGQAEDEEEVPQLPSSHSAHCSTVHLSWLSSCHGRGWHRKLGKRTASRSPWPGPPPTALRSTEAEVRSVPPRRSSVSSKTCVHSARGDAPPLPEPPLSEERDCRRSSTLSTSIQL